MEGFEGCSVPQPSARFMLLVTRGCFETQLPSPNLTRRDQRISSSISTNMKAPLLRAPNLETHQLDRSEPVQAAPSNPARSISRIGVPRLESKVSHLHLAQMRSVNWLGQSVEHLVGAFRYALPMEPNTFFKHHKAQGRSTQIE